MIEGLRTDGRWRDAELFLDGWGEGLRIEELWEDEQQRWWRTKLASCAPDWFDRKNGGRRSRRTCRQRSAPSSSPYLSLLTTNIWPFCVSFWLIPYITPPAMPLPLFIFLLFFPCCLSFISTYFLPILLHLLSLLYWHTLKHICLTCRC